MIFAKPSSEQEAVSLLSNSNGISRILGGGTDVLVQMRSGIIEPDLIVDIGFQLSYSAVIGIVLIMQYTALKTLVKIKFLSSVWNVQNLVFNQ